MTSNQTDLHAVVRTHCEDLERCAALLAKQPGFSAAAAEISVAAAELLSALADTPLQQTEEGGPSPEGLSDAEYIDGIASYYAHSHIKELGHHYARLTEIANRLRATPLQITEEPTDG